MKYLLALFLIALPLQVSALEVPEAPTDYLLDQADILSESYETALKERLSTLEDETTAEIGVLTIDSLDGDVLEWYALEVLRGWGIGQERFDNGVLILISEGDRAVRIEVGYGLEGAVTDANSSAIINQKMIPEFKEGDYEAGLTAGLDALIIEIENEAENFLVEEVYQPGIMDEIGAAAMAILFLFVAVFIGLSMTKKKTWKKWQKRPLMLVGAVPLLFLIQATLVGWIVGLAIAFGFQLIIKSMNFAATSKGGSNTWGSGGGFGGGSFGGGSSGGFGGGSGGGGGASGRW